MLWDCKIDGHWKVGQKKIDYLCLGNSLFLKKSLLLHLLLSSTGCTRCLPDVPNTVDAHIQTLTTTKALMMKTSSDTSRPPVQIKATATSCVRLQRGHCVASHDSITAPVNEPKHWRTHYHCSDIYSFLRQWIHSLNCSDTAVCF